MKSVSGAQDVEKAQEPQRPCDTLDGVTQRQTPHREHGATEGSGWILDREPHTAHLAGHPWSLRDTAGAQVRTAYCTDGKFGWREDTSRFTQPLCDMLHPPSAKHQAGLQRDQGKQDLPRDERASVSLIISNFE